MSHVDKIIEEARRRPPSLDPIRRARIEDAIVSRHGAPTRWALGLYAKAGVAVTLSMCALVAVVMGTSRSGPQAVASRAVSNETTRILPAELGVGHASLRFAQNARGVVYQRSDVDGEVVLDSGHVEVEFHPLVRGSEHFAVRTGAALISVVGTVFSVAVDAEQNVEVVVKEGRVKVASLRADHRVVFVSGGERVRLDGAGRLGVIGSLDARLAAPVAPVPVLARVEPVPSELLVENPPVVSLSASSTDAHSRSVRAASSAAPASTPSISPEDLMRQGDLARRARRFDEAEAAYAEARVKSRVHSTEWFNALFSIAKVARARGDKPRALALYREYVSLGGPLAELANVELCALGECSAATPANSEVHDSP